MNSIYAINHYKFFDNLVLKKRLEMASIINKCLKNYDLNSALDIGTTNDLENDSSNILIKKIKDVKIYKSISDQKITSKFFNQSLNKSITSKFTEKEILEMSSDLVISNATIEHVGSKEKQIDHSLQVENIFQIFYRRYWEMPLLKPQTYE